MAIIVVHIGAHGPLQAPICVAHTRHDVEEECADCRDVPTVAGDAHQVGLRDAILRQQSQRRPSLRVFCHLRDHGMKAPEKLLR